MGNKPKACQVPDSDKKYLHSLGLHIYKFFYGDQIGVWELKGELQSHPLLILD